MWFSSINIRQNQRFSKLKNQSEISQITILYDAILDFDKLLFIIVVKSEDYYV